MLSEIIEKTLIEVTIEIMPGIEAGSGLRLVQYKIVINMMISVRKVFKK